MINLKGKRNFYKKIEKSSIDEAYCLAEKVMIENLQYEDTQNGLISFALKKKPVWTHSDKKN